MIIGVTGTSGSGKSYIARKFFPDAIHIEIDKIGHQVIEIPEVRQQLINAFGEEIALNRKKLGDLVFNNREAYKTLVDSTWSHMEIMIDTAIMDVSKTYVLDWILLPKTKYFEMCDLKILVKRNELERIEAAIKRDNLSNKEMGDRDKNSIDYDESKFNIVYNNNSVKRAVYPGSFDPFTNGHLHIYNMASAVFDEVIILIADNPSKKRVTDPVTMCEAIKQSTYSNKVFIYAGLIADYCQDNSIKYLIRGLRSTSDYLYEEEIAKANAEIYSEIETVYFRAKDDAISSTLVRTLHKAGKDISKYIPFESSYCF